MGKRRRPLIFAALHLIVWFTFGLRSMEFQSNFLYELVVSVGEDGLPYHECYEILIEMGAIRLMPMLIEKEGVNLIVLTEKEVREDVLHGKLVTKKCNLKKFMGLDEQDNYVDRTKDLVTPVTYKNDQCGECLFNYCEISFHIPGLKLFFLMAHMDAKDVQLFCIKACGKEFAIYHLPSSVISLPRPYPMKFSEFKAA
ncbi:hypothetical protein ABG067_005576 [Albugo candida]